MRRFIRTAPFVFPLVAMLLLVACSEEDSPVNPPKTVDYYPFAKGHVWTYTTNAFTDTFGEVVTIQTKIDTATSDQGLHHWMHISIPDKGVNWLPLFSMLDSAGVVYALGDHPGEQRYPMFKHVYADSVITRETITVHGKTWQTIKVTMDVQGAGTITWWLADGVGVIREHSMDGLSLFTDDMDGEEVLTELVSYTK
ncbi:MAG: hypothetical protein KFF77_04870 [Bacteroidetes bacterium]|nr:hypothetical protein [Bacteroidota bacterium]